MAKRTARDFSRKEIWDIATLYAKTVSEYSSEYFSEKYSITRNTFYTLLERAVIENIVNDEIVLDMANKAAYNSKVKAGEAGEMRSRKHYGQLIERRKTYMLSKEDAISITTRYASCEVSKTRFVNNNYITTKLFDRTLYRAVVENWVSDETVQRLQEKSLKNNDQKKVLEFWSRLLYFRNENKKNQG